MPGSVWISCSMRKTKPNTGGPVSQGLSGTLNSHSEEQGVGVREAALLARDPNRGLAGPAPGSPVGSLCPLPTRSVLSRVAGPLPAGCLAVWEAVISQLGRSVVSRLPASL